MRSEKQFDVAHASTYSGGADYPDEPHESILSEAVAISKSIAADDVMRGRITVHLRSTGSHSKMLLSDDGARGWVGAFFLVGIQG